MSWTSRALFALGILVVVGVFVGAQMVSIGCSGVECDVTKWTSVVAAFVLGVLLTAFLLKKSSAAPKLGKASANAVTPGHSEKASANAVTLVKHSEKAATQPAASESGKKSYLAL